MACTSAPRSVFVFLLLFATGVVAAAGPATARQQYAAASLIQYEGGRLNARIENRPLVEVLRELAAATGARVILSDPGSGQASVSAAVESRPFSEGVKKILKGLSYAIYLRPGEDLPTVVVLSSEQTAGAPLARADQVFAPPAARPRQIAANDHADRSDAVAREQAEREKTLNEGIAALRPGMGQPSQQALDQLVGIHDPRATQALVQAAAGASDARARAQATEALWHHAADLGFADQATASALQRLASDADPEVQRTARQALDDMNQYRQRNSAAPSE